MTSVLAVARLLVLARSGGLCEGCGAFGLPRDVHHRQPRGMGGVHGAAAHASNAASNLLALCRPCHDLTEDQPTLCRQRGWLVQHPSDPATAPAWLFTPNGYGRWLLDDEGDYHWTDPDPAV